MEGDSVGDMGLGTFGFMGNRGLRIRGAGSLGVGDGRDRGLSWESGLDLIPFFARASRGWLSWDWLNFPPHRLIPRHRTNWGQVYFVKIGVKFGIKFISNLGSNLGSSLFRNILR